MIPPNSHIGIVGYGNVGSHLSQILANNPGVELSVYNRSSRDQQQSFPNVQWVQHLGELASASTIILSVSDDAIETVAKELRLQLHSNPLVCHTAGSVESDVLAPYFKRYGVLYPLQTFSIHKPLRDWEFPVFITASSKEIRENLRQLADWISPHVHEIDDQQRLALHIAAVFVCNYTNILYTVGQKICQDHHLDFKYLIPLIDETAEKLHSLSPKEAQTGPAIRGDREVLMKHMAFLQNYDADLMDLYQKFASLVH